MKRILYICGQVSWGLPQTLAGFAVFLINLRCPHVLFHGAVCTGWKKSSGLSLGLFIFVPGKAVQELAGASGRAESSNAGASARAEGSSAVASGKAESSSAGDDASVPSLVIHEYGHTFQSLIWGPLYLFTVGLPSFAWFGLPVFKRRRKEKGISYYSVYPENQADRLGELYAKKDL